MNYIVWKDTTKISAYLLYFVYFQLSKSKTIDFINALKIYFMSSFNKLLTGRVGCREERCKWISATSFKLFAVSVHPLVRLPFCLSVCLSQLYILLSVYLLVHPPFCLFVCLISLLLPVSVCLFICLSVWFPDSESVGLPYARIPNITRR